MPLDDDLRRQYSGPRVVDNFSALALVVDEGPFGRMMANLYLRVADLEIATQLSRPKVTRSRGCSSIDHPQVDRGVLPLPRMSIRWRECLGTCRATVIAHTRRPGL